MNITEFLEARIAEDEAIATAAAPGPWIWKGDASEDEASLYDSNDDLVLSAYGMHSQGFLECSGENAGHITRHDPSRVLAECAAKRAIIELSANWDGYTRNIDLLRAVATVYKDHPDYQQEWGISPYRAG